MIKLLVVAAVTWSLLLSVVLCMFHVATSASPPRVPGRRSLHPGKGAPRPTSDVTRLDERRRRRAPTSIAGTPETELDRPVAEGEHVVLRCLRRRPDDHEHAGIEIVRLDDHGRIVERWGVPIGCSDLDVDGDRIIRLLLTPSSCTVQAPSATTTR
jgi:hypothetical protein